MAQPSRPGSKFTDLPKYRAPSDNRQSLIQPSLVGALRNRLGFRTPRPQPANFSIGWLSVGQLREQARRDALSAAVTYTSAYRDLWFDPAKLAAREPESTWLVAGHQPELFHPGVWFKNFLLSQAAQQTTAIALNLVIDNDLCRSPAIRVPALDTHNSETMFRTESVAFDAPSPPVAWECRSVLDTTLFDSFPERAGRALVTGLAQPLVGQLWKHAREAARRTGNLGMALAQARHAYEGDLGLQTLELPLSQLCQQISFAQFSLAILADLPRFQQHYNQQRSEYRQANNIRSQSHPVPALATKHGWFEAPWWIYRLEAPTRRRLFARMEGDDLLLSDQAGWQATIEGPLDSEDALNDWLQFAVDGVLLRPRALITTMFARLVISDLFMHGIGGGKYDQMTDAIISSYFGIQSPEMIVATATLLLPLAEQFDLASLSSNHEAAQNEQAVARQLRYHPEQQVQADGLTGDDQAAASMAELLQTKERLLRNIPPRGEKWQWHRQITRVNEGLAELNKAAFARSQERLHALAAQQRQLKLAYSREFSFCLFEQSYVAEALSKMATLEFDQPAAK